MTDKLYQPSHTANFFLEKADDEGMPVSNLKLLKLVYFGYGWTLAVLDRQIFDEPIEAWPLGPVVPSLYHEFKRFGSLPIIGRSLCYNLETREFEQPIVPPTDRAGQILNKVWGAYKNFSPGALSEMTHKEDSPWTKAYKPGSSHIAIPDQDIKSHFKTRIETYLSATSRESRPTT